MTEVVANQAPTQPGMYWAYTELWPLNKNIHFNCIVVLWGNPPFMRGDVHSAIDLEYLSGLHVSDIKIWGEEIKAPYVVGVNHGK